MKQHDHFFENNTTVDPTPVVKNAAYFRARAREALKGKWKIAVVLCLLASLLGGVIGGGFTFNFNLPTSEADTAETAVDWETVTAGSRLFEFDMSFMMIVLLVVLSVISSLAIQFFVSSPTKIGYQRVNLDLVDGKNVEVKDLFIGFQKGRYWKSVWLNALQFLILGLPILLPALGVAWASFDLMFDLSVGEKIVVSLASHSSVSAVMWMLLFAVLLLVGAVFCIVFGYAYRFSFMVLAEYPETRAADALRMSRNMMKGHKLRLFCLELSFIGWTLLASIFTFGIGMLWVVPYREAAIAAFYDDIANRSAAKVTEFPSLNFDDYQTEEPTEETPVSAEDHAADAEQEDGADGDEEDGEAPRAEVKIDPNASMPFTNEILFPSLDFEDYNEEDVFPMKKKKKDDAKQDRDNLS